MRKCSENFKNSRIRSHWIRSSINFYRQWRLNERSPMLFGAQAEAQWDQIWRNIAALTISSISFSGKFSSVFLYLAKY